MGVGYGSVRRHTKHNTHIEPNSKSALKLIYPYHPLFGEEIDVFGAAGGKRDLVYVRLKDRSTRGVPLWMFDQARCAGIREAVDSLVEVPALLNLSELLEKWRSVNLSGDETANSPFSNTPGDGCPSNSSDVGSSGPVGIDTAAQPRGVHKTSGGAAPDTRAFRKNGRGAR